MATFFVVLLLSEILRFSSATCVDDTSWIGPYGDRCSFYEPYCKGLQSWPYSNTIESEFNNGKNPYSACCACNDGTTQAPTPTYVAIYPTHFPTNLLFTTSYPTDFPTHFPTTKYPTYPYPPPTKFPTLIPTFSYPTSYPTSWPTMSWPIEYEEYPTYDDDDGNESWWEALPGWGKGLLITAAVLICCYFLPDNEDKTKAKVTPQQTAASGISRLTFVVDFAERKMHLAQLEVSKDLEKHVKNANESTGVPISGSIHVSRMRVRGTLTCAEVTHLRSVREYIESAGSKLCGLSSQFDIDEKLPQDALLKGFHCLCCDCVDDFYPATLVFTWVFEEKKTAFELESTTAWIKSKLARGNIQGRARVCSSSMTSTLGAEKQGALKEFVAALVLKYPQKNGANEDLITYSQVTAEALRTSFKNELHVDCVQDDAATASSSKAQDNEAMDAVLSELEKKTDIGDTSHGNADAISDDNAPNRNIDDDMNSRELHVESEIPEGTIQYAAIYYPQPGMYEDDFDQLPVAEAAEW